MRALLHIDDKKFPDLANRLLITTKEMADGKGIDHVVAIHHVAADISEVAVDFTLSDMKIHLIPWH
ncbi:hypothetical protein WI77_03785 [Burkholderia ubonensis]|nr:hypothetical protein WI77_03785 [Burkholderia ubonensis]OJA51626.1 hypothetical protein BGV69_31640 [Burkholderia ubonensis]